MLDQGLILGHLNKEPFFPTLYLGNSSLLYSALNENSQKEYIFLVFATFLQRF